PYAQSTIHPYTTLFRSITNEIKEQVYKAGKATDSDVVITEIGGTVGDIESLPFLEAIRQIKNEVGRNHVMYIHCTLVPYIKAAGDRKSVVKGVWRDRGC